MKTKQTKNHNFETTDQVEAAICNVQWAIDSLIELEGSRVFPTLPSEFSKTLERLRHERSILEGIAGNWY
jgi:hypothetical protein